MIWAKARQKGLGRSIRAYATVFFGRQLSRAPLKWTKLWSMNGTQVCIPLATGRQLHVTRSSDRLGSDRSKINRFVMNSADHSIRANNQIYWRSPGRGWVGRKNVATWPIDQHLVQVNLDSRQLVGDKLPKRLALSELTRLDPRHNPSAPINRGILMARVKIEEVIDDLSTEIRRALVAAVQEVLPDAEFDGFDLFRAFKRAVGRRCNTWETVRDDHVEAE